MTAARYVWAAVAGVGIVVGAICALYALTPDGTKPSITPLFSALVTGLAAAIPAVGSWIATHRQSSTLDQVQHNTNGALTQRINDALDAALARAGVTATVPAQPSPAAPVPVSIIPADPAP